MTAIKTIVNGVLDYTTTKGGIDLDLSQLDSAMNPFPTRITKIVGTAFDDEIAGSRYPDQKIQGGGGDDLLSANGLYAILDGGSGDDTADFSSAVNSMYIELENGASSSGDKLVSIENLIGASRQNNTLIGDDADNQLAGGKMADWLDGGTGSDTMIGGGGSDRYIVDSRGDVLVEIAGEGTDRVASSISYVLLDDFEDLELTGRSALNGTGNEAANLMLGNDAANALLGMAGNDTMRGNGGADEIDGGAGRDLLYGGSGADLLTGGSGDDLFVFSNASDSQRAAPDHILDFTRGDDRIHLRNVDADSTRAGNQNFDFIGTDDFGKSAGELRFEAKGADMYVYGDTNGDGIADFTIVLDDYAANLKANDFIL